MDNLYQSFQPSSKEDWLEKITKDLKGKPIEGLNWQIEEHLIVTPFAHADDFSSLPSPLVIDNQQNHWQIGTIIKVDEVATANQEALADLSNGATSLSFHLADTFDTTKLKFLLKNIQLQYINTHFVLGNKDWKPLIQSFETILKANQQQIDTIACTFQIDLSPKENSNYLTALQTLPNAQAIAIHATPTDSITERLANLLRQGNEYLKAFEAQNIAKHKWNKQLYFILPLEDNYFINIAFIRALKTSWQQILTAWGTPTDFPFIEVQIASDITTDDENYDTIKATTLAMAAISGGANRLYLQPNEEVTNFAFRKRIYQNIQHIIQLESYMDNVADPAAGSYYIEQLTDKIAATAWQKFQQY